MLKPPIYMDHHATTPVDPRVLEAMLPCFKEVFGNAASRNHSFGWEAEKLVEKARTQAARLIGAAPEEIFFTSGATESNNTALKGAAEVYREKGNHLITQPTEHKSVLDPLKSLEKKGFVITQVPVDRSGWVDAGAIEKAVTDKTILISVMAANNEIGTLQPIEEIGRLAKKLGIFFHVDAAQAAGKIPIDVGKMGIDLLSFTGHKMYGPKGSGILYVRKRNPRVRITPLIHGGGHEGGVRSGTLNVPAIVGLGKACEIAGAEMTQESERVFRLRNRLHEGITRNLGQVYLNGHPERRLSGNLNLSFAGVEGEALLMALSEEIAVSSGSACTTAKVEPSHVLKAIGAGPERTHSSVRFGLGRFNTEEEVDFAVKRVSEIVAQLREVSPLRN